jgi:hypothetical protein
MIYLRILDFKIMPEIYIFGENWGQNAKGYREQID